MVAAPGRRRRPRRRAAKQLPATLAADQAPVDFAEADCAQSGAGGQLSERSVVRTRCVGCEELDQLPGTPYCIGCWEKYLDVFRPPPDAPEDESAHRCGDCGCEASFCGGGSFTGRRYCTRCYAAYATKQLTLSTKAVETRPCAICLELEVVAPFHCCYWCWDDLFEASQLVESSTQEEQACAGCGHPDVVGRGFCEPCWKSWHKGRIELLLEEAGEQEKRCKDCGGAAEYWGTREYLGYYYCEECWYSWPAIQASFASWAPSTSTPRPCGHFDFIEVGTSNWGTLTQYCAGDSKQASSLGYTIHALGRCCYDARGLAVECMSDHLEALPSLPNVTKVSAAMDEFSGEDTLYYVSAENVAKHMGKYFAAMPGYASKKKVDVMWYALSLSSIGAPHPELEHMLRSVDRIDLLEQRRVPVLCWEDLCAQHGVVSVDVVQIDCEGKDCAILRGLLAHCDRHPDALPRVLVFEANRLTAPDEIEATLNALLDRGYKIWSRSDQNIVMELPGRGPSLLAAAKS